MTTRRLEYSSTSRGVARGTGLARLARGLGRALRSPARLLLVLAAVCCWSPAFAQEPAELVEGRRLFDALEYEQALPLLDRAVAMLEPQAFRDPASRAALVNAFELRARARFGMGNREGAVADFRALLGLEPGFTLAAEVSPRVVALLDEVRVATVGTIELSLDPGDAQLVVDGVPRSYGDGRLAVAAGAHTLRVSRTGFRSIDQPVTVMAGQSLPLRIALERTSSVVTLTTAPSGAEVFVNGVSKGRTETAAAAPTAAAMAAQLQVPQDQVAALVLTDLSTGSFDVEFRRDCYLTEKKRITIAELGDLAVEPVVLRPAVGSLVLDSEPSGAAVLIDGDARGQAPVTIDGVCAGTHVVEFRSSVGRAVERVALESGASLTVRGRVRPAFALLSAESGDADPRIALERAFAPAEPVLLYAPAADVMSDLLRQSGATATWFGLGEGDPPADLRDRARRLADALGAQGLAWVQPVAPGAREVRVALLTPGSTEPDEIRLMLDQPDSLKQALERLQAPMVLTRGSLGAAVIDVLDVKGAVVIDLDAGQAAAEAGLAAGDVIHQLDGQPIDSALDFESKLASLQPGQQISLGVRSRSGQSTAVPVLLRRVPAMVTTGDRALPANVTVAVLRALSATTTDPALQPIVKLNLAAALIRSGDGREAQALLKDVSLPPGPGVSAGAVQYLLGEAALAQGDQAGARQHWEAAAQAEGRLTSDGPSVKALATRALARLK
jgi:hypothetical protein